MSGEIKEKLAKATAVESLLSESDISRLLGGFGWQTVHSAYYTDNSTGKFREIDIVGTKSWHKNVGDETSMHLSLLIECKSLDGFHIVFSMAKPVQLQFQTTGLCAWAGYLDFEDRRTIARALAEYGYESKELEAVFSDIERIGYPKDMVRVHDLILKPFPALSNVTSYRETNTKIEKDLPRFPISPEFLMEANRTSD